MRRDRPRGFSLLELVVAMAITGLALAIAGALLESAITVERSASRAATATGATRSAEALLRGILAHVGWERDTSDFEGDVDEAHFSSVCPGAFGDLVACHVRLRTDADLEPEVALNRWSGDGVEFTVAGAALVYLSRDGERHWQPDWRDAGRPPGAIGVIVAADTVPLVVGRP